MPGEARNQRIHCFQWLDKHLRWMLNHCGGKLSLALSRLNGMEINLGFRLKQQARA